MQNEVGSRIPEKSLFGLNQRSKAVSLHAHLTENSIAIALGNGKRGIQYMVTGTGHLLKFESIVWCQVASRVLSALPSVLQSLACVDLSLLPMAEPAPEEEIPRPVIEPGVCGACLQKFGDPDQDSLATSLFFCH